MRELGRLLRRLALVVRGDASRLWKRYRAAPNSTQGCIVIIVVLLITNIIAVRSRKQSERAALVATGLAVDALKAQALAAILIHDDTGKMAAFLRQGTFHPSWYAPDESFREVGLEVFDEIARAGGIVGQLDADFLRRQKQRPGR